MFQVVEVGLRVLGLVFRVWGEGLGDLGVSGFGSWGQGSGV